MNKSLFIFFVFISFFSFAQWDGNTTPNYPELISICQKLAKENKEIELYAMGESDYGLPIYTLFVNGAGDSLKTLTKAKNSTTILINNAIHPGEPDGVNAMLLWLNEWINNGKPTVDLPVLAFIPAYNVGGMMNRSGTSRANQDGPAEYGFRGNAQNLDLNRDFIKMDSKNAFTFVKIFQAIDPDIFIDNHVTNGADYQYILTLISPMKSRMMPTLRKGLFEGMLPALETSLAKLEIDLAPYVDMVKTTPDDGLIAFDDLPRYAMGYASLFHSYSFTVETHMLKPFPQRVQATKAFMEEIISYCKLNSVVIELSRKEAKEAAKNMEYYSFNYQLDKSKVDSILFKGFAAKYKKSKLTGMDRLYYDRIEPWAKYVPFYTYYKAQDSILVPKYYLVGGQAKDIIERLRANGVEMNLLTENKILKAKEQRVETYKSIERPYENHFMHHSMFMTYAPIELQAKPGDYLIPAKQEKSAFVHSVLLAATNDSYFVWNFMDSYLDQKEYFSPYVFEDIAAEMLKNDAELRADLENQKKVDSEFAESQWAQLFYIYKRSAHYEKSVGLLPIYLVD